MNTRTRTTAHRTSLAVFLRHMPRIVSGYPIVTVGEYTPGDPGWASARVITVDTRALPNAVPMFNVHTLVWSEQGWDLQNGTYNVPYAMAADLANLELGAIQAAFFLTFEARQLRQEFANGGGAYGVYTAGQKA